MTKITPKPYYLQLEEARAGRYSSRIADRTSPYGLAHCVESHGDFTRLGRTVAVNNNCMPVIVSSNSDFSPSD